jgi:hypothetical protein
MSQQTGCLLSSLAYCSYQLKERSHLSYIQGWQSTIITTGTCTAYSQGGWLLASDLFTWSRQVVYVRASFHSFPLRKPAREIIWNQFTTSTKNTSAQSMTRLKCEKQIVAQVLPREYPHLFQRICGPRLSSSLSPVRVSWYSQQTALCFWFRFCCRCPNWSNMNRNLDINRWWHEAVPPIRSWKFLR